jgi:hypothetical protein
MIVNVSEHDVRLVQLFIIGGTKVLRNFRVKR